MLTKRQRSFAGFILLSFVLVGFSALLLLLSEIRRWDARFGQQVQIVASAVRKNLDTNEAVLAGFAAFLQAVNEDDEAAATRYAAAVVAAYPQIYMMEVARGIPRAEQHAFEELLRLSWRADFKLKDFASLTQQPTAAPQQQLSETWPVLFTYPQPPQTSAILGVRLETVGHLAQALAQSRQTTRPVASPVFSLYEGGQAYILLQPVNRPGSPNLSAAPNFFGSTMVALILLKTDTLHLGLQEMNLDPLLGIEVLLDSAVGSPSQLLAHKPQAASALDHLLLPGLRKRIEIDSASQPTTLLFERQLRLGDVLTFDTLAILLIIMAALVLLPVVLMRHFRSIAAVERDHARSTYLATHDTLTGLPNRQLLADRFDEAQAYWQRHGTPFALMLVDLDRFKDINDRHGHEVGDQVLRAVAAHLRGAVRAYDTAARYGGDEFVVLVRDVASPADAETAARKILQAVNTPTATDAGEQRVACSIGVALCPHQGTRFDALLNAADQAMYGVKRDGRDNVALCCSEP